MKNKACGIPFYIYVFVAIGLLCTAFLGSKAVTIMAEKAPVTHRSKVIIDAGHGGVDGGATSCTGVLESNINLEIALKLDDLFHLLGVQTVMIRTGDYSVYTEGQTIAAKKISDLKERVRIAEETENATVISIHQNYYPEEKYSGAQVFFNNNPESKALAQALQSQFIATVNPGRNRRIKKADGVYFMEHITCPGVLVECGFLSNPAEEAKLRNHDYQNDLCCVIAATCSQYLQRESHLA